MSIENWWHGPVKAEPDFGNLLAVLRCEAPARPTLFEFFLNERLYAFLNGQDMATTMAEEHGALNFVIRAFRNAGYDYVTMPISSFGFPSGEHARLETLSLNEGAVITNRASMESYAWPDPDDFDTDRMPVVESLLSKGMKCLSQGPCGVLENTIKLVGYDQLCYLLADDPGLVQEIVDNVGSRLVRYYEKAVAFDAVGGIIGNDDWGFKSQPMLSPDDMRRYILPWHKKIVAVAHAAGKPAILHSCGNLASLMDDIIDDLKYDGKHSYEDNIQPVEQAYEQYGGRIAILGGLDVDFVIRSSPDAVYERAKAMLARSAERGGYALGTGNSVPAYVPDEHYLAMIRAAVEGRG